MKLKDFFECTCNLVEVAHAETQVSNSAMFYAGVTLELFVGLAMEQGCSGQTHEMSSGEKISTHIPIQRSRLLIDLSQTSNSTSWFELLKLQFSATFFCLGEIAKATLVESQICRLEQSCYEEPFGLEMGPREINATIDALFSVDLYNRRNFFT